MGRIGPKIKQIMHLMRGGFVPTMQEVKDVQRRECLDPIRCDLEWGDIEVIRYRPEIWV